MKDQILNEISRIENEKEVKVILACETGSRAWGFPSPDSDYDVRMIYVHKPEWYISIYEKEDSIEFMSEDGMLDITGWDVSKALKLLQKSNSALLERLQSPIVYKVDEESRLKLWQLGVEYFNAKASMHHYFGLAKTSLAEMEGNEEVKLKKLFYALRAVAACRWIRMKSDVPDIEFKKVYSGLDLDSKLIRTIEDLIELKSLRNEDYFHPGNEQIMNFIDIEIKEIENCFDSLPVRRKDVSDLDFHFRQIIMKAWNG